MFLLVGGFLRICSAFYITSIMSSKYVILMIVLIDGKGLMGMKGKKRILECGILKIHCLSCPRFGCRDKFSVFYC